MKNRAISRKRDHEEEHMLVPLAVNCTYCASFRMVMLTLSTMTNEDDDEDELMLMLLLLARMMMMMMLKILMVIRSAPWGPSFDHDLSVVAVVVVVVAAVVVVAVAVAVVVVVVFACVWPSSVSTDVLPMFATMVAVVPVSVSAIGDPFLLAVSPFVVAVPLTLLKAVFQKEILCTWRC